jgi:hypothetical protein
MGPWLLVSAVFGCSATVYYPRLTQGYDGNVFEGLPEDTGGADDTAASDTAADTGAPPCFGTGVFETVPCSGEPPGGPDPRFQVINERTDGVRVFVIEQDGSATFRGTLAGGSSFLGGPVGQTWAATDDTETVLHGWIQVAVDNPDPWVIQ